MVAVRPSMGSECLTEGTNDDSGLSAALGWHTTCFQLPREVSVSSLTPPFSAFRRHGSGSMFMLRSLGCGAPIHSNVIGDSVRATLKTNL